ncbi:MAG TPA: AcrB/AcrD/AcrF family protein, partial [Acidobacteria bacterium]|nr:AcrB/AcrD/AcrF family protein [Acidobacteriota bacterium]
MKGTIDWFARNGVAANLMMVFIVVTGIAATTTVREEIFPEIELDRITIEVPYLGAAPEEVEQAVNIRIEEAIQGTDGIKQIQSTASEGMGTVIVELELGADARKVIDDVKSNVDAITTFPIETEKPIVREMVSRMQVTDIAVSGYVDPFALKAAAVQVRDELTTIPGITQVDVVSAPPYEISVEVSEISLRRHGLTFDQVADAVRRSSLDLPGGSVRTEGGEILLRTIGQAYRGDEYENLVLWTRADGSRLVLGDVATVVDGFAETDQFARFDVTPTMMVSVFRTGEQSALEIAALVHDYIDAAQARLPDGITLTIWQDGAAMLSARLSLMLRTGAGGFVLVFLVLALFLELRLAIWVSLGIPISFLGAMALMPGLDVSINIMSLFAFVTVLGIVVDDAIIVGENIFRHQEDHGDGLRGSIEGAQEIAKPVIFAVLTTVAAFTPLMFVPGMMGKIFRVIPLIVIPCLLFSLVESLGILPAHLSHMKPQGKPSLWRRFQSRFANGLKVFIQKAYRPTLLLGLRWRYLTAAIGVAMLVLTIGMVAGGWTNFRFFPSIEADVMAASVTLPQGTPVGVTSAAVEKLEAGAARLRARLFEETGQDYFRHVAASIGDQPMGSRGGGPMGPMLDLAASNVGEVTIELAPSETRAYNSEQLGLQWREITGPIPEAVDINFNMSIMTP